MTRDGLHLDDLTVWRGDRPVVNAATLTSKPGQITALLGPNGAGKSSLVLAIAGAIPVRSGSITIDGDLLRAGRPERTRRAGLAVAPEGHRVLRDLTVGDNLRVAAGRASRHELGEARSRVLDTFPELHDLLDRPAGLLSGGQQQMLALAQAVINRPRYLVVDELSLGLAPVVLRRLTTALTEIARQGTGVLLIEQFTAVALSLATDAYVLSHGHICYSGASAELRDNPELLRNAYLADSGNEQEGQ